jgi:hypothetical protein
MRRVTDPYVFHRMEDSTTTCRLARRLRASLTCYENDKKLLHREI